MGARLRRGDGVTGGRGDRFSATLDVFPSPRLPVSPSPCPQVGARAVLAAAALLIAPLILCQQLSDLEPERPISVEDARPVPYRAFSGAADWTFNEHSDHFNDHGPGFSLLYGAARGLEVGAAQRYVTRPGRNAGRGIASGDLFLHALYGIRPESASWPALAVRADVQLPTGLDSKGTDLHLAALATRSFDAFRVHGNFLFTRLGDTSPAERADRWQGIAGIDFVVSRRGLTDSLFLADVVVSSNPIIGRRPIIALEGGGRRRIGTQTIVFAGAGSEVTGNRDRRTLTLRLGISRMY